MRASLRRVPCLLLTCILGSASFAPAWGKPYEETEKKHSWFSFNRPKQAEPAAQMQHADDLQTQGRLRKAGRAYQALYMKWPGAPEAVLARLGYARSLDARGKPEKAFEAYQTLMEDYAGGFPYDEVLKRQYEIAQEVMGRRRGGFFFFAGFQAPERAVPLLEEVLKNGPRSPYAPEAQYLIGLAYEQAKQLELAVVAYMTALNRYPLGPYAEKAAQGRARALYQLSEESPNDEEALDQAWAAVSMFLNNYPLSEEAEVVRAYRDTLLGRRARAAFEKARFYDRHTRKPAAALQSYRSFVKMFPGSEWAEAARARINELEVLVEKTP